MIDFDSPCLIKEIQINYQLKNRAIYTNVKPTVNKVTDKNQKGLDIGTLFPHTGQQEHRMKTHEKYSAGDDAGPQCSATPG